ncbi:citrate synthase [Geomicrobium sp. JCM 19037]|uniref:citrate synthase/methylcitrate synthase n=1 Tax=Geomicrobium sp. JCM 19037 TaxID=1460634 RepID=UPI00045F28C0|nr:citrate synthase/methylcitrate synthase [Geomicrobium sp. JCM 19037]GAK04296.1 citrate synthase [Geomicrobium sp. JCM 19037]
MNKGLEGIVVAETMISDVDGKQGTLLYRGIPVGELATERSFEDVVYLLWNGDLPSKQESAAFSEQLKAAREIPEYAITIIEQMPKVSTTMEVLRTVVSSMSSTWPPTIEDQIKFAACFPTIIAYTHRDKQELPRIRPNAHLNHVENYMYMLTGERPVATQADALTAYLILTMEHGMNASTFAARVVASTESTLTSAITGALGAMSGPLHGGAPTEVLQLIADVQNGESIEEVLRNKLENGEKLMGFGHRVYKTSDPRAEALKRLLARLQDDDDALAQAVQIEQKATELLHTYKPGRDLHVNVEFYAAALMDTLAIDHDLLTPTFCVSRITGWCAHVQEQAQNNRIFRPDQKYIG